MKDIFQKANDFFDMSPFEINCGDCIFWASLVVHAIPGAEFWDSGVTEAFLVGDEPYHAFVKISDLFYDAECHEGVTDHNNLPFFQREGKVTAYHQPNFKDNWRNHRRDCPTVVL